MRTVEQFRPLTDDVIRVAEATRGTRSAEDGEELRFALLERQCVQSLTVQGQQVEGEVDKLSVGFGTTGRSTC